jgi:hypothetical protein
MQFEGKDITITEKYNKVYRPCLKDVYLSLLLMGGGALVQNKMSCWDNEGDQSREY